MYSKFQCISRFHHEVMCHLEHVTLFYYIASEEKLTRSGSEEKLTRSGSEEKLTRSGQPKRPFVCQVWDYFLHKCYRSNHTAPKGSNVTGACISSCSRARCLEILVVCSSVARRSSTVPNGICWAPLALHPAPLMWKIKLKLYARNRSQ